MIIKIDVRPISVNAFWGRQGNRTYVSAKGKEWREYIQYHLIKHKPTLDRFDVTYEFHFKGKRKLDTTNYIKPLEDTLTGFIWEDDEQCDVVTAKRFYNATHDYVIIKIKTI
jgi:Holliday junction resolvase RusA-like endonuclease